MIELIDDLEDCLLKRLRRRVRCQEPADSKMRRSPQPLRNERIGRFLHPVVHKLVRGSLSRVLRGWTHGQHGALSAVSHRPPCPETIAGTLAYMAPEQTGRMNRSIDARSDLYALGVTFYQMLTDKQPINAAAANAAAAIRWLGAQPANLQEVRQALDCIVNDAMRAGDIIGRIRELFEKAPPRKDGVDINEAVREVIELTRGEAAKHGVSVQSVLGDGLLPVRGDRVHLQQVMLNLMVNAIEAMSAMREGPRDLLISTTADSSQGVSIAVSDSGLGLPPSGIERVFDPLYTTKAGGLGMGLSICRSIVDAHGGQLSAKPNVPRGAVFQFVLLSGNEEHAPAR
jgi:signal transduction histidine kinase